MHLFSNNLKVPCFKIIMFKILICIFHSLKYFCEILILKALKVNRFKYTLRNFIFSSGFY